MGVAPIWRGYWLHPVTGQLGARMPLVGDGPGAWSVPVNGVEGWRPRVAKRGGADPVSGVRTAGLLDVESHWWQPWAGGAVLTLEIPDLLAETPWIAGPVVRPPQDGGSGVVELEIAGVGAVLRHRVVTWTDFGPSDEELLQGSQVVLAGMGLGELLEHIVYHATGVKRHGGLPIVPVMPRESAPGQESRYYGWNLAGNGCWSVVSEIAERVAGPDLMLVPAWADDDRGRVVWEFWRGSGAQPEIPQSRMWTFDPTVSRSGVVSVTSTVAQPEPCNRVYAVGAGGGAGIATVIRQDLDGLEVWEPLLERVVSVPDTDDPELLAAAADSAVAGGRRPLVQLTLEVAWETAAGFRPGWTADVVVADHLYLPDGVYPMLCVAAKSGSAGTVVLEMQPVEGVAPW